MVLIKPNHKKISSNYLLYAMLSAFVQKQITQSKKTGSIVSNLRIPLLKELEIPLVSGSEKIAAVLSALDAKIDLNNRINAELEAMAKTLYDYWFVQFDFPDKNGKPYKSSGGKMVWNKELKREIPAGWEAGVASDLFIFNPSLSLPKDAIGSYIDMSALPTSGFMTDEVQQKPFNGGVKFQNGDVVVARITPCLENGKTGLITLLEKDEIGFGSTEFIVLRGKRQPLSSFAACLSRSELFRKFAIANMTGTSGRKRIEAKTLETFGMPLPPEALLSKFEETVASFFKTTTVNAKQNQHLSSLREWLLPMLMNGQVTVDSKSKGKTISYDNGLEPDEVLPLAAETVELYSSQSALVKPTVSESLSVRAGSTGQNIPQRILAHMHPNREYSRADLTAAAGISATDWTWAIKQLKEERKVRQTGEKRGARYVKAK
jgi:type I restriction enzyme, S subunit